jgi:hypothetical protein
MKYKITMFLSSLLLFLCLFYYWQRENEFQRQLERVELRAFIERNQDKDETMRTIMNVGGVAEVKEVATAEIIKMIRDDIGEGMAVEEMDLPYVLSIYPLNKGEENLRNLALRLTTVKGVIDVVYGQEAVKGLWRDIRKLRVLATTVGVFLLFFFILALSLYINTLPAMKHSRVFLLHGKGLTSLRIEVVFKAMFVSIIVSILSVGITYLSYLYILRSPSSIFLPNHWIYYFVSFMMFIGLLAGCFKRFPISR